MHGRSEWFDSLFTVWSLISLGSSVQTLEPQQLTVDVRLHTSHCWLSR